MREQANEEYLGESEGGRPMTLTIDKEFETLIPPLSADEYRLLEESILAEG